MRRIQTIIASFLVVISLIACGKTNQSFELAVCGSYAVPGMMCFDLKGNTFTCEIKETDPFGRILFSFNAYNHIERKNAKYYVICQLIDSKKVFYYEDICFIRYTDNWEALQNLKDVNDWNKPLVLGKMSTRHISISADLVLQTNVRTDFKKVKNKFCQLVGTSQECVTDSFIIDSNEAGQTLYVFCLESIDSVQKYIVLCDMNYDISWMIFDVNYAYEERLIEFKQQNGWFYERGDGLREP